MKTARTKPAHVRQRNWDAVDFPPLTGEQLERMRPANEIFPDLARFPKPIRRGLQKAPTKVQTTIRLDREVVEYFRASGRGWQSRINQTLRRTVERGRKRAKG